ncbi:MAG TPA: hypothetical protein VMU15_12370 [Anaeromyxobacter sp.]|nr:hypothetical protein [Anaeromyxobacter sp.]
MNEYPGKELGIAAMAVAGALAAWAAWACHRARRRGLPGGDAAVWALLAAVFLGFAGSRLVSNDWYIRLNVWLRVVARQHHLYQGRRPFQVAASLLVVAAVAVGLTVGVAAVWDYIKRYRLAIGFTALAVGAAAIRFVSLHEVDAWFRVLPWLHASLDLVAAAGASILAVARLWRLRGPVEVRARRP